MAQFTAPGAGSPATSWLDKDGSGSVTTLLGSGDTATSCVVDYDPFGSPIGISEDRADDANAVCASGSGKDTTGNAVWYRSAVRDASYGTYQFGARTYDRAWGRSRPRTAGGWIPRLMTSRWVSTR